MEQGPTGSDEEGLAVEKPLVEWEALAKLIRTRRSIRRWQDRPVPDELILRAIDLATWAPNGGNYQPWQFLVIKNRALIQKMADVVQAKAELIASWPEAAEFAETVQRWRTRVAFFREAPVCIAVLMGQYQSVGDKIMLRRGEADPVAREMIEARRLGSSRLQSVAAAIAYLLLALHQMGLGACWMGAPQQAKKEIEQLLDAPPEMHFVALVPVGYPAEAPEPGPRKPLEEVVKFFR